MRPIGLIGGMSWESSANYYLLINEQVRAARGGLASAPLVMHSFDFAPIAAMQAAGEWDALGAMMADAARGLHAAGAEALLICTNTMHKVADAVVDASPARLIHIADPLAAALMQAGHERVGLLGTRFTMNERFYADRLAAHGLSVVLPQDAARAEIDRVIFEELCVGTISDLARILSQGDRADDGPGSRSGCARLHRNHAADLAGRQRLAAVRYDRASRARGRGLRSGQVSRILGR